MERKCVIPSCILLCDRNTPYCSKYHQTLDKEYLYASLNGLFLCEGYWGPPWPILLQSTLKEDEDLYSFIRYPESPEILINYEENSNICLTPADFHSQVSSTSSLNTKIRSEERNNTTPTIDDDEQSWHVKGESQSKKRKNNEIGFSTPNGKNLDSIEQFNKETEVNDGSHENKKRVVEKISPLKRKKRSQLVLALNYKISEDSKPVAQRQLNISEYFRKKPIV